MDSFLALAESVGDVSRAFSVIDISIVLILSFLLVACLGYTYQATYRGVSYSQAYVHTLVIMGVTIALVMLIVGSNIARAFALVGALSIVRFRNAMKETRDIGFVFAAMGTGMAVGTRFYLLAVTATAALCLYIFLMTRLNLFAKDIREWLLRVQLPVDRNPEEALNEPLGEFLAEYRLVSVETVRAGALQEVLYSVVLKKTTRPNELLEGIRMKNDNLKVVLTLASQEINEY